MGIDRKTQDIIHAIIGSEANSAIGNIKVLSGKGELTDQSAQFEIITMAARIWSGVANALDIDEPQSVYTCDNHKNDCV
jgi:hypothetical protein